MKILITGGAGFIGSHVAKRLQQEHEVVIYDNRTDYGYLNRTELQWLYEQRLKLFVGQEYRADIRDASMLGNAFYVEKPELVIHMASHPRGAVANKNPYEASEIMSTALINMLQNCKWHGVKRFVYVSSSMVYGDFNNNVREEEKCIPKGIYSILKYAGEMLVKDYCMSNNMECVVIRPSAVYGPYDVDDRVVSKFLLAAMYNDPIYVKGPDEILDFTYVTDTANGIELAATANYLEKVKTYNITRGEGRTLLEAAELAKSVTNSKSEIIFDDRDMSFPKRGALNINKAVTELQYIPSIDIEQGFKLYADWLYNDSIFWSR